MGGWNVAWIASALVVTQTAMQARAADAMPADAMPADAMPIAPFPDNIRQQPPEQQALVTLVGDFVHAQLAFDVPRLTALTTADYLEISPVGEVDGREKMLGFYAPANKTSAPSIEVLEPLVRIFGDTAIIVVRLSYTMSVPGRAPDQPPRVMALRASFVARRDAGRWKLASAQYTGIRAAAK